MASCERCKDTKERYHAVTAKDGIGHELVTISCPWCQPHPSKAANDED